jgi:hypothetical protein
MNQLVLLKVNMWMCGKVFCYVAKDLNIMSAYLGKVPVLPAVAKWGFVAYSIKD